MSSENAVDFDKDLNPVINACSNEELDFLVQLLTGTFTNMLVIEEDYKKYYPDHQKYANLIAAHIRMFGGNTFANAWRGLKKSLQGNKTVTSLGPEYREIVSDVAKTLKVEFNKNNPTEDLELLILKKITEEFFKKATEEQKKALLKDLGNENGRNVSPSSKLAKVIAEGGINGYRLMTAASHFVLCKMSGRGLPSVMTFMCSNVLNCCADLVSSCASSFWLLFEVSSPASRITIPAVIYVALLRNKQKLKQLGESL